MLETNIDDMNSEIYSYLMPKLFEIGALDVYLTNIMMKKNRPGVKVNVLATKEIVEDIEEVLFKETTTLGIRKYEVTREKLNRKFLKVDTSVGKITVKLAFKGGRVLKYAPEYEECKLVAESLGVALQDVYQEVLAMTKKYLENNDLKLELDND
nr:nickel insertion protein [Natroniella sulfidigena]